MARSRRSSKVRACTGEGGYCVQLTSRSRSQRAVDRAALLANWVGAQLLLLHVMEPDQMIAQSLRARKQIAQQQ